MSGLDSFIGNDSLTLFCELLLMFTLVLNIGNAFYKNVKIGTGYLMLFLVMVVYCAFYSPEVGDNFSSMESYYDYLNGVDRDNLHFERIYFYIMDLIPFGYIYYRIFLWGSACLLCVWFLKRISVNSHVATLSVLTFALPILLYYQRAAFAYVLIYVALYCYISRGDLIKHNRLFKSHYRLVSVMLLLCALPFHRAMPVYVAIALLSLLVPKNKIGIACLVIGLVAFSFSALSNSILLLDFFSDDTRETAMVYLDNDTSLLGQNFNGALANILRLMPLYIMLIYGMYKMIKTPNHFVEFEKLCIVNTLILVFISYLFTDTSFSIQIKFYNAAMMPWTLFLASYYTRNRGSMICTMYAVATIFVSFI